MRPLLAALVFGVMLQPLLAFASRPPSIQEFMLNNGLKLIVYEDHHAPLVHSHLWYRIGSNQEGPGQTGLSHALEHMLFNGSSKLCSGESDQILQHLGGSENATTLNDATLYFHTLPAHALGVSFEILADQMSTAHLSATQWGGEREVIKNERSESFENHPLRRALELPRRLALPASAAGNPVIGWRHDLDRLQIEDLKHWYGHWYAPNNAVLVVTGDVDAQQVKQLAERYFGAIARRPLPYSPAPLELPTPGERRITQIHPSADSCALHGLQRTQPEDASRPHDRPGTGTAQRVAGRRKQLAVQDPASPSGRLGERHNRSLHGRQSG